MYLVQLLPPALGEICEELSPRALLPCVPSEVSQGKGVRASSFAAFLCKTLFPHLSLLPFLLLLPEQTTK